MDPASKIVMTATVIASLILGAQWLGEHAAGLVSGLPLTLVPALWMVAQERGAAAAADVASAGVVGCALACLFAATYHRAAQRLAPLPTLLAGLVSLAAGLAAADAMRPGRVAACGLTLLAGAAAWVSMRRRAPPSTALRNGAAGPAAQPRMTGRSIAWAVGTGTVSASVAVLTSALCPWLAGVVAAMPMVGVAVVASQHLRRGPAAVAPHLRGYLLGSMARSTFCATFAICATRQGVALAMLTATLLGLAPLGLGWLGARRASGGRPRRGAPLRRASAPEA